MENKFKTADDLISEINSYMEKGSKLLDSADSVEWKKVCLIMEDLKHKAESVSAYEELVSGLDRWTYISDEEPKFSEDYLCLVKYEGDDKLYPEIRYCTADYGGCCDWGDCYSNYIVAWQPIGAYPKTLQEED